MKRAILTAACAAGLAVAAPAALAPSALAVSPRPLDAQARMVACHPAAAQPGRYLLVEGAMRLLPATSRMQIRFDLYRRLPSRVAFLRVAGPGLGYFYRAAPAVARYVYRKRVAGLYAPGYYRVAVSYRWLNAAGHIVASTSRLSPICFQPDLRPDLQIVGVTGAPGTESGTADYAVTVRNAGRSAAGPFDVTLSVGTAQTVPGLLPGQVRTILMSAPRCDSGGPLIAEVDPDNRVGEAVESNNRRFLACPARRWR